MVCCGAGGSGKGRKILQSVSDVSSPLRSGRAGGPGCRWCVVRDVLTPLRQLMVLIQDGIHISSYLIE